MRASERVAPAPFGLLPFGPQARPGDDPATLIEEPKSEYEAGGVMRLHAAAAAPAPPSEDGAAAATPAAPEGEEGGKSSEGDGKGDGRRGSRRRTSQVHTPSDETPVSPGAETTPASKGGRRSSAVDESTPADEGRETPTSGGRSRESRRQKRSGRAFNLPQMSEEATARALAAELGLGSPTRDSGDGGELLPALPPDVVNNSAAAAAARRQRRMSESAPLIVMPEDLQRHDPYLDHRPMAVFKSNGMIQEYHPEMPLMTAAQAMATRLRGPNDPPLEPGAVPSGPTAGYTPSSPLFKLTPPEPEPGSGRGAFDMPPDEGGGELGEVEEAPGPVGAGVIMDHTILPERFDDEEPVARTGALLSSHLRDDGLDTVDEGDEEAVLAAERANEEANALMGNVMPASQTLMIMRPAFANSPAMAGISATGSIYAPAPERGPGPHLPPPRLPVKPNIFDLWHGLPPSKRQAALPPPEAPDTLTMFAHVDALYVYPIKSGGAFRPARAWPLTAGGLLYDRRWVLLGPTGAPLTQRKHPALATLKPTVFLAQGRLKVRGEGGRLPCLSRGGEGAAPPHCPTLTPAPRLPPSGDRPQVFRGAHHPSGGPGRGRAAPGGGPHVP